MIKNRNDNLDDDSLEGRISRSGKYSFKTESGSLFSSRALIDDISDLTISKNLRNLYGSFKSFIRFSREELKEDYVLDDFIVSTSAQLVWVNWLQIGIQKLSGINQEAVDKNFVLTTGAGLVFGYLYSLYRDFKTQRDNSEIKNSLKDTSEIDVSADSSKSYLSKKSYWSFFPKRSLIKRTVVEGKFLASWHFVESVVRYRLLGEHNADNLAFAGLIFSAYGFVAGNIYAYTIDFARHFLGIDKSFKNIDNIFEKNYSIPKKYVPNSNSLKRFIVMGLAASSVYASYLVKSPSKNILESSKTISVKKSIVESDSVFNFENYYSQKHLETSRSLINKNNQESYLFGK